MFKKINKKMNNFSIADISLTQTIIIPTELYNENNIYNEINQSLIIEDDSFCASIRKIGSENNFNENFNYKYNKSICDDKKFKDFINKNRHIENKYEIKCENCLFLFNEIEKLKKENEKLKKIIEEKNK
jgi:hypothetical protein